MKKSLLFLSALLCTVAMTFAQTYVVTGANTAIFGTAWDNKSACILEKQTDGSYAWTKTDVELPAGQVEYKMLEQGTWDGWQLPVQGNASFNIDKSGKYDITFTLSADLSAQNAVPTLKEEVAIVPTIILHGTFSNPNWGDSDPFVYNADNSVATLTLALEAQTTYEFGMKFDGAWKANGAQITSANNSTNLGEGSGNMQMTTTVAGNYVFTYTVATQVLAVAYPGGGDEPGPQPSGEYYVTGNEALVGADKAWKVQAVALDKVDGIYTHTFSNVAAGAECQMKVTNGTWESAWGYDDLTTVPEGVTRGAEDNNIIFTLAEASDVIVKFDAEAQKITLSFETLTSISATEVAVQATKIIRNGQVLIIRDGVAYDMMGQEVK